jgi:hypothetical protein
MPIVVDCGGCGKRIRVRDAAAGRVFKCPICGQAVSVQVESPAEAPVVLPIETAPDAVPSRLAALESETRSLRRSLLLRARCLYVAVAVLGLLLWVDSSRIDDAFRDIDNPPTPRVIEAEAFVVKNPAGEIRAALGRAGTPAENASYGLHLYTGGKERGSFAVAGGGQAGLICADAGGQNRLVLTGEGEPGGLSLLDPGGGPRLDLGVAGGAPRLFFFGEDDRRGLGVGLGAGASGKAFIDTYAPDGKGRAFLDGPTN